jgi:hypothetical protein
MSKYTIVYLIALVLLYPIVAHYLMSAFDVLRDQLPHGPIWIFIQIFISGPILLFLGLVLLLKRKNFKDLISGLLFTLISVCWMLELINEVVEKS